MPAELATHPSMSHPRPPRSNCQPAPSSHRGTSHRLRLPLDCHWWRRLPAAVAGVAVVLLSIMPAPLGAQALDIRAALTSRSLAANSGLSASSDGEWVAYTVRRAEVDEPIGERRFFTSTGTWVDMIGTDIWVSNVHTGGSELLTGERGNNWAPAWSPDGESLAYYSDRSGELGLWVWDQTTRQHRRLSNRIVRAAISASSGPSWLPDGSGILAKFLPEGRDLVRENRLANALGRLDEPDRGNGNGSTAKVIEHRPGLGGSDGDLSRRDWWTPVYGGDLAVVHVTDGSVRSVARDVRPFWWAVSPDGRRVAYLTLAGTIGDRVPVFHLAVVNLQTGHQQVLDSAVMQEWGDAVRWSPDSRHLAYYSEAESAPGLHVIAADGSSRQTYDIGNIPPVAPVWTADSREILGATRGELWRVRLHGEITRTQPSSGEQIQCIVTGPDRTLWTVRGGVVVCAADPTTVRRGFSRCNSDADSCQALRAGEAASGGASTVVGLPSGGLIASLGTEGSPLELWLLDHDFAPTRRLSSINPQLDRPLAEDRLVEWTAADGKAARGTLLLPLGHTGTGRVPVVVSVYPGILQSSTLSRFDAGHQILATRGYAVFLPDMPLAGKEPVQEIVQATLDGIDHLITSGIADSTRLAVMGHSYGGYGVLAIITQTDRFRAAIAAASQGNLISKYNQLKEDGSDRIAWAERGQGRMGGTLWEVRERYIENSPFFRLDHVTTPLLLLHGEADPAVPVSEADATFIALRRLNRRVAYARYEGEGHVVSWWSLANRIDYWHRIVSWLDEHLQDTASAEARD